MSIQGWKYYNHAMIPECPPNQEVDISAVKSGEIWHSVRGGHRYLYGGHPTGIADMKRIGGM